MVPMARIERATSPLPRECSTTELHGQTKICLLIKFGAGEGNRTLILSLEGFCSTIELHPQSSNCYPFTNMVEGEGFEPSKAEPTDLQSAPFDRSGTPPKSAKPNFAKSRNLVN